MLEVGGTHTGGTHTGGWRNCSRRTLAVALRGACSPRIYSGRTLIQASARRTAAVS